MWDTLRLPAPEQALGYYDAGWWRTTTFLDDLHRHAAATPDRTAVVSYESGKHARTLTYADLAETVDRFASALTRLGVQRGDIVVLYMPNRWMLAALHLACNRIGAVSSPVLPEHGGRELGYVLDAVKAKVCITIDSFAGVDFGARLAEVAPGSLAHRVVIGDAGRTGAVDFDEFFMDGPADPADLPAAGGPDEPALLIYTSGTTGRMKGVVHSPNTLYAAVRAMSEAYRLTGADVITTPHYMTHMVGTTYAVMMPAMLGATSLIQDTNTDIALQLDLIEAHRASWMYASPSYLYEMLEAQRRRPRDTSSLRCLVSGSTPVKPELVTQVRAAFDVPLHTLWGMTENGAVTLTSVDDPEGWGAHSDGRPVAWMDVRIDNGLDGDADPDAAQQGAGRLLVRGASQCLGYYNQRDIYDACVDADGWFDTGDLARDDGRGGIRITGRRSDLIIRRDGMKVPTLEVESVLAEMEGVGEVVLIGYPDPDTSGAELVCAVIVPRGQAPTLGAVRDFLRDRQMTWVRWPDRVECVSTLPRNSLGKVLRPSLRAWLASASSPELAGSPSS